jgi:periplasmic mercuric ion binding protein
MKSIKLSLAILVATGTFFVSCKKEENNIAEKTAEVALTSPAIAKTETASFDISGMTCAMGCAKTIETKLSETEGVETATVNFDKKTATVSYNAALQTPEKLVEIVEAVSDGKTYKVSNLKSSADKAMLYQETPKQEKKKNKKAKTAAVEYTTSSNGVATTPAPATTEKKPACCSAKKACSEKPATL